MTFDVALIDILAAEKGERRYMNDRAAEDGIQGKEQHNVLASPSAKLTSNDQYPLPYSTAAVIPSPAQRMIHPKPTSKPT